jgi:hypothetical protein
MDSTIQGELHVNVLVRCLAAGDITGELCTEHDFLQVLQAA